MPHVTCAFSTFGVQNVIPNGCWSVTAITSKKPSAWEDQRKPNSIWNSQRGTVALNELMRWLICLAFMQQLCFLWGFRLRVMYRSIPKPPMPPPGQTPGHLTFLKNFGQIPRYVAGETVKCPTRLSFKEGQIPHPPGMLKQLWNTFCKIFSHYEFLVQLVFAPHFKQRHIPRYNYIKRQQQKNPRGIDKSNDPWTRLTLVHYDFKMASFI